MKFRLVIDKTKDEEVVATVHAPSRVTEQIEELIRSSISTGQIPGYTEDDMVLLSFDRIECITVLDGKTYAIDCRGVQYRLKQRLYETEKLLPAYFVRINKSTIANERRLERFTAAFSGSVDAVFKCGYRDYVSRRCFAEIKRRYEKL